MRGPGRVPSFRMSVNGGEGGIRTLGTRKGTTVFETAPFDRSGTSPHWRARPWATPGSAECSQSARPGQAIYAEIPGPVACAATTVKKPRKNTRFRH